MNGEITTNSSNLAMLVVDCIKAYANGNAGDIIDSLQAFNIETGNGCIEQDDILDIIASCFNIVSKQRTN